MLREIYVLVIEDNLDEHILLAEKFLAHGFQAKFFTESRALLNELRRHDESVAVIDHLLKGSDDTGYSILRQVITEKPLTIAIIVSGMPTAKFAEKYVGSGAFRFLPKNSKHYYDELCAAIRDGMQVIANRNALKEKIASVSAPEAPLLTRREKRGVLKTLWGWVKAAGKAIFIGGG